LFLKKILHGAIFLWLIAIYEMITGDEILFLSLLIANDFNDLCIGG